MVFELYNFDSIYRRHEMMQSGGIKKVTYSGNFYEYRFSPSEIEDLFKRSGLKRVRSYGVACLHRNFVNMLGKYSWVLLPLEQFIKYSPFSKKLGYYFIVTGKK